MSVRLLKRACGNLLATLQSTSYVRSTNSPASFQLNTDGFVYAPLALLDLQQKYKYSFAPNLLEARSTLNSGSFTTDPSAGTFIALTSTRTWVRNAGVGADLIVTFTIDIRPVGGSIIATAAISLECDRT